MDLSEGIERVRERDGNHMWSWSDAHPELGPGVKPGPVCTCVQASDTGHDSECPRAAFARGASS